MDQTSGLEKYPKHQETKDFYIIYRSERLEGKEEYIELSESYKVSEFVGCNWSSINRVIHSTMAETDSDLSSGAPLSKTAKQTTTQEKGHYKVKAEISEPKPTSNKEVENSGQ